MTLVEQIVAVSDAYAAARQRSRSRVSTLVFGDGKVMDRLANDQSDLTTGRFEKAMQWFSDNWPEGASWPKDVERPKVREVAA